MPKLQKSKKLKRKQKNKKGCEWIVGKGCRKKVDAPEVDAPEVNYAELMRKYIAGETARKTINKLTKKYRIDRFNAVKFHGTKFGKVGFFRKCLENSLGKNWPERVLNPKDDLSDVAGVSRLGVPGRQGTTIKIKAKC